MVGLVLGGVRVGDDTSGGSVAGVRSPTDSSMISALGPGFK